eukprot:2962200-Pyramimonas_sp.AAC.1
MWRRPSSCDRLSARRSVTYVTHTPSGAVRRARRHHWAFIRRSVTNRINRRVAALLVTRVSQRANRLPISVRYVLLRVTSRDVASLGFSHGSSPFYASLENGTSHSRSTTTHVNSLDASPRQLRLLFPRHNRRVGFLSLIHISEPTRPEPI